MSAPTKTAPHPAASNPTAQARAAQAAAEARAGNGGGRNIPDNMCPIAVEYSTVLTGDWRALRPVVDRDRCVKCATCWLYCPVQCIVEKPTWFDVDLRTCKGCGICAEECPHRAIQMIEEGEG